MPEGDTLFRLATRMRPLLLGREIVGAEAREPAHVRGLDGAVVSEVRSVGKHLLIGFDDETLLRVHLGIKGRWFFGARGARWPRGRSDMGLLLSTESHDLVCFWPKAVERFPRRHLGQHKILSRLGPDLADVDADLDEVFRRAREEERGELDVADLLLDQRVSAGLGNVYKCEALFLERLHPWTAVRALDDDRLRSLLARAHRLLRANLGVARRNTTGLRQRRLWVYGQSRRPCLVCGGPIAVEPQGEDARLTWWCPHCQREDAPLPASASE